MSARCIIHVDMDAFFASVEVLDNPSLQGKPVIVGGSTTRGVVSAASYEARAYGVHSAMPMIQALRRCPHAVVIHGRMSRYHEMSHSIMAILATRTPLFEQVSVDEAYLDVTNWLPAGYTGEMLAQELQTEISHATGLSCSLGVATGKAIAKMASDHRKPHGLVVVPPGEEGAFLAPMPIGKLRGVGEATERKLHHLGVRTIGDLARLPVSLIEQRFGVHGRELHALANGHDDSPVVSFRQAKSIGREVTFPVDITDREVLERTLLELAEDVGESLRRDAFFARGLTLKIRYDDFATFTRSQSIPEPTDRTAQLYQHALTLFHQISFLRPIRLIGISATPLQPAAQRQLSLFSSPQDEQQRKLDTAMDMVRARFGNEAIKRARFAEPARNADDGFPHEPSK